MKVDRRIALAIECALTAHACEAAAIATGLIGWREIASEERREASDLLDDYVADRGASNARAVTRRGQDR